MRPKLNTFPCRSRKCLIDDSLCVLFYLDDSVRLEMTRFVQAVSVKMMNLADGGRESDENIETSILIASVCPCLISIPMICLLFHSRTQKPFCQAYFSIIPIKFLDRLWNARILLKEYY